MSAAQRDKGARGEREVADIWRAAGFDCNRVPNSGGLRIKGDLYGSTPAHVEVKRHETARPWAWWEQASGETPQGQRTVVAFRRSRSPWLALVDLTQLAELLAIATEHRELAAELADERGVHVSEVSRWVGE